MKRFIKQSEIQAPVEKVFAFHEQPEALEALTPPWEPVEIVQRPQGLQPGTRAVLRIRTGPLTRDWIAEHTEYIPNRLFADKQLSGPFAYWYHRHHFEPTLRGTTLMTDEIEYALPLGWLGELFGGWFVKTKLEKMFTWRHQIVAERMRLPE
jgi:hypothetical protein